MAEEIKVEEKKKFDFVRLVKGKNRIEYVENVSYLIIGIAAVLLFIGIMAGSFVYGTIYIASIGSLFVFIGIIVFIVSQFMEIDKKES